MDEKETRINAHLETAIKQRDEAHNVIVALNGEVAVLRKRLEEAQAKPAEAPPT